jgi:hypothetical protein
LIGAPMRILFSALTAVGLLALVGNPTSRDELKIFGSRVTKMMVDSAGPEFERASNHKLVMVNDVAAVMKRWIEAGERVDVAMVNFQADDLIKRASSSPIRAWLP